MKKQKTRREIMIENVIIEAKNLKQRAWPEELSKLNFNLLDSESRSMCIYGQMTGNCRSHRAIELITTCAKQVYDWPKEINDIPIHTCKINGAPDPTKDRERYFSPIEVFIDQPRTTQAKQNKKLISYLKGETETLDLK